MIQSDEQWLATIDAFHSAAIGTQSWEAALTAFAAATGSRSAQLRSHHPNGEVTLNVWTNLDPALHRVYADTIAINPRVESANRAPLLKVESDLDFITPEQIRRDRYYQEYLYPNDVPFVCRTLLEKSNGVRRQVELVVRLTEL